MRFIDHSADEIRRMLGLTGPPDRPPPGSQELSLLLRPAFHPEIALRFTAEAGETVVEAVCARRGVDYFSPPAPVPVAIGVGRVKKPTLLELETAFRAALAAPDRRASGRDGMTVHVFWRFENVSLALDGAVPTPEDALGRFIAATLQAARAAVPDAACAAAALAEAGAYLAP